LLGLAVVAVVVAGTVSWVSKFPAARAKVAEKQLELEAFAGGARNPGGTMEQRLDYYRSAISAFCEEPLLGLGLDGWTVYYYGFEKSDYPHNIVLEVAAEQGLVGVAALLAFIVAVWLASRRIWRTHPEHAFAIPLCVYTFLVCMFSADINLRTLWFWSGTIFALSRMSRTYATEKLKRFAMPARVVPQMGTPALQTISTVAQ
jgi:O-antigen ligase